MIKPELMEILRCPVCVKTHGGVLRNYRDSYLICDDCRRKYPIMEDIPVMLIDEGTKTIDIAEDALPIPPVFAKE